MVNWQAFKTLKKYIATFINNKEQLQNLYKYPVENFIYNNNIFSKDKY